ncbi:MAG TPA: hypothetical protein VGE41_03005, partial [Verrucomicrobiae bacterium]
MERNFQKNGLVNFLLLLSIGVASFVASRYSFSLSGQVASFFVGLGALVAGLSWFQMRLHERERLEKLEFDELTKSASGANLFNAQETESFPARRAREQFERFFIPGFTVFLFLLEGFACWWLWHWLQTNTHTLQTDKGLISIAMLGLFALVLFIIGMYSANLARLERQRLLRPSASHLLLGAYLLAFAVAGIIFVLVDFPRMDELFAYALVVLAGLLAVENAVSLLLDLYRPRVQGQVGLLLYESRLTRLLSHPEGLFTTAAHALDYQFGFKVSETWFFQFLQKALVWIILGQLAILLLS